MNDHLATVTQVLESNNVYWVNGYLQHGWRIVSVFHTEEFGIYYVIGWPRTDEDPVPVDFEQAAGGASELAEMIAKGGSAEQFK